jgi:hypothetical protein
VIPASRRSGIDAVTGEGLAANLEGVDVVVDVPNSPSLEERAVLDFFTKSSTNIAREAKICRPQALGRTFGCRHRSTSDQLLFSG